MTDFDDNLADMDAALLEAFGVAVTYAPAGGEPEVVVAEVGPLRIEERAGHRLEVRDVRLLRADAPEPAVGDLVTRDGETWAAMEIAHADASSVTLTCRRGRRRRTEAGRPARETP